MELPGVLGNVLFAAGGAGLFFLLLYKIAIWARRRASGAYVLGAFLIPLGGMGNVSDPDFKIVNEAQQIKKKEEDDTGDPLQGRATQSRERSNPASRAEHPIERKL